MRFRAVCLQMSSKVKSDRSYDYSKGFKNQSFIQNGRSYFLAKKVNQPTMSFNPSLKKQRPKQQTHRQIESFLESSEKAQLDQSYSFLNIGDLSQDAEETNFQQDTKLHENTPKRCRKKSNIINISDSNDQQSNQDLKVKLQNYTKDEILLELNKEFDKISKKYTNGFQFQQIYSEADNSQSSMSSHQAQEKEQGQDIDGLELLQDLSQNNLPEIDYVDLDEIQEKTNQQFTLQFDSKSSAFSNHEDSLKKTSKKVMDHAFKSRLQGKNLNKYEDDNGINKEETTSSLSSESIVENKMKGFQRLRPIKKKRTRLTPRILADLQILFRQFEQQQKYLGNPFYQRNITLKQISEAVGISATQARYLYDQFLIDPLFTMRLSKINSTSNNNKPDAVDQQLEYMRFRFMEALIAENSVISQQEMAERMNQCPQLLSRDPNGNFIPINCRTVQDLLRRGNYARKKVQLVPRNRNSPQNIENRYHYCIRYLEIIKYPNVEIYYLDQSRFNPMTARDRGWAKKGNPGRKTTESLKEKDVVLLAMICLTGLVFYELNDGYNTAAFTIVMEKVCRMLNQKGHNPHRYIVIDNSPTHNRQSLKEIEQTHRINIVFLPPYTPMLNPIEYWFSQLKGIIRSKTYKTRNELKSNLQSLLMRFFNKSFKNYFDFIKPNIQLGINRELCR